MLARQKSSAKSVLSSAARTRCTELGGVPVSVYRPVVFRGHSDIDSTCPPAEFRARTGQKIIHFVSPHKDCCLSSHDVVSFGSTQAL